MILVAYRHGLRVSEICDLRWDQIDFVRATLAVRRVKKGTPARIRSRRRTARPAPSAARAEPAVAVRVHIRAGRPVRQHRLCPHAGARWRGREAAFKAHPHMLRHSLASRWPTKGRIRGRSRAISGIEHPAHRAGTLSCRRHGSGICGDEGTAFFVVTAILIYCAKIRYW